MVGHKREPVAEVPKIPNPENVFTVINAVEAEQPKKIEDKDKDKFIPETDLELIKQDGEKYVTITINNKLMHYLFIGLGKYREGFQSEGGTSKIERDNVDKAIDELNNVKDILTGEKQPKKTSDNDKK